MTDTEKLAVAVAALKAIQADRAANEAGVVCTLQPCEACHEPTGWPLDSLEPAICEDCLIAQALAKAEGTV